MKEWEPKIEQCSFIDFSSLTEGLAEGDNISGKLSEDSSFTWGDTNRSMVDPGLLIIALKKLDDEDCEDDMAILIERVESLNETVYIDLAN